MDNEIRLKQIQIDFTFFNDRISLFVYNYNIIDIFMCLDGVKNGASEYVCNDLFNCFRNFSYHLDLGSI